ncbi:hypothetical protein PF003_g30901 [Phytophthora fragariae]|nr:hypothetical protein PF003_g30901 [Phytophthora fragariae]
MAVLGPFNIPFANVRPASSRKYSREERIALGMIREDQTLAAVRGSLVAAWGRIGSSKASPYMLGPPFRGHLQFFVVE